MYSQPGLSGRAARCALHAGAPVQFSFAFLLSFSPPKRLHHWRPPLGIRMTLALHTGATSGFWRD